MKDIIIAGIQWSGKWTQCKKLLEKFGDKVKYYEAGGMLRTLQSTNNPIGNYIWSIIDNGGFIPDVFMVKLFELFLLSMREWDFMLLDGFPRKPPETEAFLQIMEKAGRDFILINLDISEDVAIDRLTHRYLCKKCKAVMNKKLQDCTVCPACGSTEIYQREDDKTKESIMKRLWRYKELCDPMVKMLEARGCVKHVNGDQDIEKVFQDILSIL